MSGRPQRKKKIVLFQPQQPKLRITADSTLGRPPRLTFGYSLVSGSSRLYAQKSNDVAGDRVFFVENWCTNEQALFGVTEGHGFQGAQLAEAVARSLPSVLSAVALEVAYRPRSNAPTSDTSGRKISVPGKADKVLAAARSLAQAAGLTADGKEADDGKGGRKGKRSAAQTPGTTEYAAAANGRSVLQQRMVEVATEAFHRVHTEVVEAGEGGPGAGTGGAPDVFTSGASLLLGVIRGRTLLIAGAGCCRAVLGREVDGQQLSVALNQARMPGRPGGHPGLAVLRQVYDEREAERARVVGRPPRCAPSFLTQEGGHGIGTAVEGDPAAPVGTAGGLLSGKFNRTSAMTRLTKLLAESAMVDTSMNGPIASLEDSKEEKLRLALTSQSMPHFPDLPSGIERVLQYKEQTYMKGSGLLQAKRAEMVSQLRARVADSHAPGVNAGQGGPTRGRAVAPSEANSLSSLGSASRRGAALLAAVRTASVNAPPDGGGQGTDLREASVMSISMHSVFSADSDGASQAQARAQTQTAQGERIAREDEAYVAMTVAAGRHHGTALAEAVDTRRALSTAAASRVSVSNGRITVDMGTRSMVDDTMRAALYPELARDGGPVDFSTPPTGEEASALGRNVTARYGLLRSELEAVRRGGAEVEASTRRALLHKTALQALALGVRVGADFGERTLEKGNAGIDGLNPWEFSSGPGGQPEAGLAHFTGRGGGGRCMAVGATGVGEDVPGPRVPENVDGEMARLAQELAEARMYDAQGRAVRVNVPVPLTLEHRPDRPDEASRITLHGGRVATGHLRGALPGGLPRVYGPHKDGPGLAVSRCIGYTSASTYGVIPTPDVCVRTLDESDKFVIVASDGVWAVLTSAEAVEVVSRVLDGVLWGGTAEAEYGRLAGGARREALARGGGGGNEEDEDSGEDDSEAHSAGVWTAALGSASSSVLPTMPGALSHPALTVVEKDPHTGARPALPDIAHPSPHSHVAPGPSVEMRVLACAGQAPVAGAGSGSDIPMDLAESLMPPLARARRADRMRRVAVAAAEAVVAAAKSRWAEHVARHVGAGGGVDLPYPLPEQIQHDDISVLVILLDQA